MQERSRWRKGKPDLPRKVGLPEEAGKAVAAGKQRALRRGRFSEWIALAWLATRGYRPLAWRFSVAGGEIDLIVRRGNVIAFVEVKARHELMDAVHAIDRRKRERFCRAVRVWLQRNPWACACSLRCDAVYVTGGWRPRHIAGAFELD